MAQENKKRFNIIDAVLILAILALFASVFIRSGFSEKITERFDNGTLEYKFIITSLKETSERCFNEGDKLYSQTTQKEIGEIVSFTTRPAETYVETANGEIVKTIIPGRIDVMVTARAKGTIDSDGRCMLDGTTHIAAGKTVYSRLNDISFMFTIEDARYIADKND